ncbi:hypothetical protein ESY86_09435 [Subsaximicrobium wynnwilliamsii]|uniref:PilN domain-containing protein n=1 Tax=Subsaximicrobium wynnwilliamsii TaxID=291179 RepID=A0A5C6ZID9_9FLAO|nr:hypothetical protein [Subsaximicrobium wynnwilliamsii]TXD83471.1 hypothetical protein ESY87_09375 [Subsaximicrobium wynnwilliamsii]TXD89254.1 hypothetical protein ESY86_09435 [Subsaximicrobium wynnwilliamsii]TXE03151.1 hypothetical protein ESY88_09085 [Subsaximicrobium wynnwilliamsii]
MLQNIWTYLKYGNRFCGMEHTSTNGKDQINCIVLKRTKKELVVADLCQTDSFEEVSKKLSRNQHAVLTVNNDQVLFKSINSNESEASKLVYKAFPNIQMEAFYYEVISEGSQHFVSICRKTFLDSLIDIYARNHVYVIDISIGNAMISNIKSFLKVDTVRTSNAIIAIENNVIKSIEKSDTENELYNVNGLEVSNKEILSLAGALKPILNSDTSISNFNDKRKAILADFGQVRFFNQFFKFSGLFLLSILLINFFIFNHYFNKVNELKQISQINQSTKEQILGLNETVTKKQKTVDDLLNGNASQTSFYTNVVMQSLPNSILLSEFNYQPLKKRIKADKDIELEYHIVQLSGTSTNSDVFSKWIGEMEQLDWITSIEILEYGLKNSTSSNFKIKAFIAHD